MGALHLLFALCLLTAIFAQKTITVAPVVSGNQITVFSPQFLTAAVGETVAFSFVPKGGSSGVSHGFQFTSATCSGTDVNCTACGTNTTCGPAPVCGDLTTDANAPFTQSPLNTAWDRTLIFNQTGVYYYYCPVHCTFGMWGVITIVAATTPPATTAPPNTFCVLQTLNCKNTGQTCTRNPPTNVTVNWDRCKDIDDVCYSASNTNDGICTTRAADQKSCNPNVGCYDGTWRLTCLSNNVCGGDKVFAPGEKCQVDPNQIAFYGDNGGCMTGLCQADSLNVYRCSPSLIAGDACDTNRAACNASNWCDRSLSVDTCVARKPAGQSCNGDEECQQDLLCINDFCALPMSQTVGNPCDDITNCVPGLICARSSGGNRVCQQIAAGLERPCNLTTPCATGYDCLCDSTTNNPSAPAPIARCVAQCTFTTSNRDAIRNYGSCLKRNNCYGSIGSELRLYRGGCVAANCLTEYQSAQSAMNACDRPNPLRCSTGSDATSVLLSIAAVIVAALALFI